MKRYWVDLSVRLIAEDEEEASDLVESALRIAAGLPDNRILEWEEQRVVEQVEE